MQPVTPQEAAEALVVAARGRRHVLERIAVPAWYWWTVALGWVALGVLTDLHHPILTSVATLVFGAVHATLAQRAVDGRRGSADLSIRRDLVGRRLTVLVLGGIAGLGALTVGASLLLHADGARHPVTAASVLIAVLVLLGGPALVSRERRRIAAAGGVS